MKARVKEEYIFDSKVYEGLQEWSHYRFLDGVKYIFLIERQDGTELIAPVEHFEFSEELESNQTNNQGFE